jgi:hypothetical protein
MSVFINYERSTEKILKKKEEKKKKKKKKRN